jgi:hypothetical protein
MRHDWISVRSYSVERRSYKKLFEIQNNAKGSFSPSGFCIFLHDFRNVLKRSKFYFPKLNLSSRDVGTGIRFNYTRSRNGRIDRNSDQNQLVKSLFSLFSSSSDAYIHALQIFSTKVEALISK